MAMRNFKDSGSPEEKLSEAAQKVEEARKAYVEAQQQAQSASMYATRLRNELNKAQQKFDEQIKAMHKNAPRGTDWHDRHVRARDIEESIKRGDG